MFKPVYLLIIFALMPSLSLAQKNDSLKNNKQSFYVEALIGIDFMNYANKKDDGQKANKTANEGVYYRFQNFNGNYFKRPPVLKLALNYKINKNVGVYAGLKYSYFITSIDYWSSASNYSMAYPQGEDTEYHVTYKTNNIQSFTGLKINLKDFYMSASIDLNTLVMKERSSGYYVNSLTAGPVERDSLNGNYSGVMRSCMGFSVNMGYDFRVGKEGQAIKLELQGDYIHRKVTIPFNGSYTLKILNPAICLGYKF